MRLSFLSPQRSLAWFIARRYLFSRERQALEWFVTIISVMGVAVGVGTIISVFGVIDGLRIEIINRLISGYAHVYIFNKAWNEKDPEPALLTRLGAMPGVVLAEPTLEQWAAIISGRGKERLEDGVNLHAADRVGRENTLNIELPPGVESIAPEPGKILISDGLTTMPMAGREVTLISSKVIKTALYPTAKTMHLRVKGIFKSKNKYDRNNAIATWADVRELSLMKQGIWHIRVKLSQPMEAKEFKARLLPLLPKGCEVKTWIEDFQDMFRDMKIMKFGMLLVMLMTILVGGVEHHRHVGPDRDSKDERDRHHEGHGRLGPVGGADLSGRGFIGRPGRLADRHGDGSDLLRPD